MNVKATRSRFAIALPIAFVGFGVLLATASTSRDSRLKRLRAGHTGTTVTANGDCNRAFKSCATDLKEDDLCIVCDKNATNYEVSGPVPPGSGFATDPDFICGFQNNGVCKNKKCANLKQTSNRCLNAGAYSNQGPPP